MVAGFASGVVVALIVVGIVLMATLWLHSHGRLKTIGVEAYVDPECTRPCTSIDWGLVEPGEVRGALIYLKNTNNTAFNMTVKAENWNPPVAENYLTLSWNYTGEILQPGDVIPVQLLLTVSPNATGFDKYSFDIVITATEV